ncbi:MAG: glycosyltransferase family 1 protein, partial [Chitinophagaceae bacterium]
MKYPHTGLYHFCLHLGRQLAATAPAGRRLCYYTPPSAQGLFGADACYRAQHSLQKFRLPATGDVDIWHNTYQGSNYYPQRRRLKVLLTIHDLNFMHDEGKAADRKQRHLDKLKRKVERADHIVAISQFSLDDAKKHLDLAGKPTSVIYNGCNIVPVAPLDTPAFVPSAPFLFTVGTIIDKKNFHVLPGLLAGNKRQLVIAGITQSEAYKARILAEAERHGVSDRVHFTGPISEGDKQWYLQHCEAFVFPSLAEGFGLPVVEALYFGKPVFLSTCTSLPEVGGSAAYYFNDFDPEGMRHTLEEGLRHFEAHDRSEEMRARAAFFSWSEAARAPASLPSGRGPQNDATPLRAY